MRDASYRRRRTLMRGGNASCSYSGPCSSLERSCSRRAVTATFESYSPPPPGEATITIYVVGHGWHTGIVIRRDDIPAESWPEDRRFPTAGFLEVGWGDRAFYESPEAGMRLALKAAFNSEASVLHVAGFDPPPATYFSRGEIIAIELSSRGVQALARFVSAALRARRGGAADRGWPRALSPEPVLPRHRPLFAVLYVQYVGGGGPAGRWLSDHARPGRHRRQLAPPGRAMRTGCCALPRAETGRGKPRSGLYPSPITTDFTSVYSSIPWCPRSRPSPDALNSSNGISCV